MEFLRELFGAEALTFDELAGRLKGAGAGGADMKLADLSTGAYVGIEKHRAVTETLKKKADEAANAAAETVQAARADADAHAEQLDRSAATREAMTGMAFTSASARTAFTQALEAAGLPLSDGALQGFDGFAEEFRLRDPAAFADTAPPTIAAAAAPPPPADPGWRGRAMMNFRAAKSGFSGT